MEPGLADILETQEAEQLATGFSFTEGPTWDPSGGYYYFVDLRANRLYRIVPGKQPELVREETGGGNGTTFDLDGNLVMCEGRNRRVTRMRPDGKVDVIADRFEGKRLNHPNDVICRSDGTIYFTDPGLRMPIEEREQLYSGVYRVRLDGQLTLIANCEFPNGLALSPDERLLFVANTHWVKHLHEIELDADGEFARRRIFADMSDDAEGVPDGVKLDVLGRIYCTGPGGTWVFSPDGRRLGIIRTPELPANFTFGGEDMRTIFFTARTSIYTLRVRAPGIAHPRFRR